jgi:hypothetical protein
MLGGIIITAMLAIALLGLAWFAICKAVHRAQIAESDFAHRDCPAEQARDQGADRHGPALPSVLAPFHSQPYAAGGQHDHA